MEELCRRLGDPQHRFRSIHVVGTNGKSSVAERCRQLLAAEGLVAGASLSPHLETWSERVHLPGGGEPELFAAAVARVADLSAGMTGGGCEADGPTQFEAATAAAFLALERAEVEVAAVEAGMGGRLDATNVIAGEVVVLTTVALDHTQWLGETVAEIATEKLAVLDEGATLVVGRVSDEIYALAEAAASRARATLICPFAEGTDQDRDPPSDATRIRSAGDDFSADNAALAEAAVNAFLADRPAVAATEPSASLPARAELVDGDPPVMLDLAHNPAAAEALAKALAAHRKPVVACVALLDDKDLDGFATALAPALDELIATSTGPLPGSARPGAAAHPPGEVAAAFGRAGLENATAMDDPRRACEQAIERARARSAIALFTGSHYLLRHKWIPGRDRS